MNMKVEKQWGERTSLSFVIVLCEDRKKEPRMELMMSEKEEMKLVAESNLFSVLESKWNFALLVRNLHVTSPRMNV